MQEKVQFNRMYDNAPDGKSFRENASLPCMHNLGSRRVPENQEAEGQKELGMTIAGNDEGNLTGSFAGLLAGPSIDAGRPAGLCAVVSTTIRPAGQPLWRRVRARLAG